MGCNGALGPTDCVVHIGTPDPRSPILRRPRVDRVDGPAPGIRSDPARQEAPAGDIHPRPGPPFERTMSEGGPMKKVLAKRGAIRRPHHSSHCGLAAQWLPALRFVAAGITSADKSSHRATPTGSFSAMCRGSQLAQHREYRLPVPLVPTNVGTQGSHRSLSEPEAAIPHRARHRSWIPIFIGTSGDRSAPHAAP